MKGKRIGRPAGQKDVYESLDDIRVELLELGWDIPVTKTPKKKAAMLKRQAFLVRRQERLLKKLERISF